MLVVIYLILRQNLQVRSYHLIVSLSRPYGYVCVSSISLASVNLLILYFIQFAVVLYACDLLTRLH